MAVEGGYLVMSNLPCKTSKGMMNRLDNILFEKPTVLYLKCKSCDQFIMVSDWYNGESLKKLLEMNQRCEECGEWFV